MFEQDRVLVRLQQRVSLEGQIAACYLTGSYGRGTQDKFSDLDVVLVYQNDAERDQAFRDRRDFAKSILPFVSVKSYDAGPSQHVALYSNGAKIDFYFESLNTKNPELPDRHIMILKDTPDGWSRKLQMAAQHLPPGAHVSTITTQELTLLDERFWILFTNIYRQILRSDYQRPFTDYIQLLESTLPRLLGILPLEDPARLPLYQASYGADLEPTRDHLQHLLESYLAARQRVVEIHNLDFVPDNRFEDDMLRIFRSRSTL